MASLVKNLVASACMSFAMNSLELGTKYIKTLDPTADEALVNLSLTFVLLSFFFGPAWGALSGGGEMNPAVLSMKWSMGKTGLLACLLGCVSIVAGYVVGIIGAAAAIEYYEFDKLPLPAAMAPPSDLLYGGMYVFAATALFQIFAVVLDQVMGNTLMAGVVTSGAFCAMVAGGCGESCAGMNPAAPIASQIYTKGVAGVLSAEVLLDLAPFVLGSVGASLLVGAALAALGSLAPAAPSLKPQKKSV